MWSVARAGQSGFFHRTEMNKKIYAIGDAYHEVDGKLITSTAKTGFDITEKSINPMGGFKHYGVVSEDFLMLKGSCPGVRKRAVVLRKTIYPQTSRPAKEEVTLKFIDTSSKMGNGRFQTPEEKSAFMGLLKHQREEEIVLKV